MWIFFKDVICFEAERGLRPTSSTQEFGQRLSQRQRGRWGIQRSRRRRRGRRRRRRSRRRRRGRRRRRRKGGMGGCGQPIIVGRSC